MNKRIIQALFFLFLMFLLIGVLACEKTYSGKVIDADTKEPIEGAVVVATWLEETATVAGPSTRFKDVKETLTDKSGKWIIVGPRGRDGGNISAIYTFITGTYHTIEPGFIVFKPGYCPWPKGFSAETCARKIIIEGNSNIGAGKTLRLPKLTDREDRRRVLPEREGFSRDSDKKQLNFLRLINEEHKNLGLKELEILKEEVNDTDPNATDAVQIFVDLKHDAVNLTKDFRDAFI